MDCDSQVEETRWWRTLTCVPAKAAYCSSWVSSWKAAATWWFSMGERSLYVRASGSCVLTRKSAR